MNDPRTAAGLALLADLKMDYDWLIEDILAIEAEASRLDVERLAAALDALSGGGLEYDRMAPEERADRFDAAERLAAEYARLAAEEQGS